MSKIIILGPAYPLRGGLATFNERLARQFIHEGHEVVIYTFSLQYPSFLFPGKTQFSESPLPTDLNIKVAVNSVNPINWFKTGNQIKNEMADIILVRYWLPFMGPCLGTILRIAKRNKKSKVVALIDNAIPHEKRPGDKWFTSYFCYAVDHFITMSKEVSDDLRIFITKDICLVPHPLYDNFGVKSDKKEARSKLNLPETGYFYLFFGFIRKYKGLDLLLEATDLLPADMQEWHLIIAGEFYSDEKDILLQWSRSKYKDKIILHSHFIKDEEVALYFSASDCVIQPYRHATQSGVTPLAYYFELPMIVTNVGALPELVPETIGLVCQPNPTSIAESMQKILTFDRDLFNQNIPLEKQKLSWSTLTRTILNLAFIK